MRVALTAIAAALCCASQSLAGPHCNTPMSGWQPRGALVKQLESENWHVTRIGTDDGCYKVHAVNDKGERLEGTYDPASLKELEREIDDD